MCCVVPLKSAFFLILCSSGSCLPTCCTKFKRNAKQYKCMPYFYTAAIEVYALFLHCWCQIPQWHVTTWQMNKSLFAFVTLLWKTQIPHVVVITILKRKIPAASSFHSFHCSVVSVGRGHLQLDTTRSLYKSTRFLLFDLALRNRRFPEITGKDNLTVFSYSGRVKSPEWRRQLRRADLRQF